MEPYQQLRRLIKILLLLTVLLTPLLGATSRFGYEQAKVLFFIVSISLMGFLWFFTKPKIRWTSIKIASSFFILVLLLTSVSGIDSKVSFLGTDPYFQGAIIYVYLFLFSLLVSASGIKMEKWTYILAGSATLVGLLAIGDFLRINLLDHQLPTYAGRVVSTFGQPNFYSGFLLLVLPFWYLLLRKSTKWWPYIISGFLITLVAIIISQSRVAFLGAAGLILFWLIRELPFKKLVFISTLTILLILSVISIKFSAGWVEKELTLLKATNNPDLPTIGVEKRYYFWPILGTLILERPIQGYGLENIAPVFSGYFEKNKHVLFEENLKVKQYMFGLKDLNLDRSHNYILDLFLFAGVFGVISYLVLVFLLLKKTKQKTLIVSLITYLIWIQFQNQSIVQLIYFWLLVGIIDQE